MANPKKFMYVAHIADDIGFGPTKIQKCRRCMITVLSAGSRSYWKEGEYVVETFVYTHNPAEMSVGYVRQSLSPATEREILENDKIEFCLSPEEVKAHIEYYTKAFNQNLNTTGLPERKWPKK